MKYTQKENQYQNKFLPYNKKKPLQIESVLPHHYFAKGGGRGGRWYLNCYVVVRFLGYWGHRIRVYSKKIDMT